MKIVIILLLAFISLSIVSANTEGICRTIEVKVTSSMQPQSQTFILDVKKLRNISFDVNEKDFENQSLVPIEQVGFVLEKTSSSKVLDAVHHKYLRNEPEQVWLPYAYTGDWSLNGFIINNQMARSSLSKTEKPLVSFEFVNDVDLQSVTDKDLVKLLANLESNSVKRKTTKSFVKNSIIAAVGKLKTTGELEAQQRINEANKIEERKKEITLEIKTLETKVTETVTTITTTEALYSTSQKELDDLNNQILNIIRLIKNKEEQIEKATLDLKNMAPLDVEQLKSLFKVEIQMVHYPTEEGRSFKDEYKISTQERAQSVKNNYESCNPNLTTIDQLYKCLEYNAQTHLIKRKLRRGKF
jgi:hypothetical protein